MTEADEPEPTLGEKVRAALTPPDAGPAARAYFEQVGRDIDEKGAATVDLDGFAPALAEDLPGPDSEQWRR